MAGCRRLQSRVLPSVITHDSNRLTQIDVIHNFYHCRMPLAPPFFSRGQAVHSRETIIIEGENGEWAEAAPLPGFSPDTIAEVLDVVRNRRMDATACHSLQFARDCLSQNEWPKTELPINALLDGPTETVVEQARNIARSRCRCVKLKVGRVAVQEDIERVTLVRSLLRKEQSLRLDANRAWDWDAAIEFGSAVAALNIEYIEEPLAGTPDAAGSAEQLERWFGTTSCPYALDETVLDLFQMGDSDITAETLGLYESVAALVIKPTLLGSIDRIQWLAEQNKPLVFSGCFESGVGTAQIARLAVRFSPGVPAGLDTHARIASDLIKEELIADDWVLRMNGAPDIDVKKLAELAK